MDYRRSLVTAALMASALASAAAAQQSETSTKPTHSTSTAPLPAVDPTPNAQRGPSGIPDDQAYRINPGDDLEIYVWGDERLQRDLRVLPDGSIAFPLVGTVRAAGHTSTQLENEIAQRLATQYKGTPPQVTISVKSPSGLTFSVMGKVRSPATFTPGRYITLLEAIGLAGGPTDFADVNNIIILRKVGNHSQVINGHLSGLLKAKPSEHDLEANSIPVLQPGDTVIVP